MIGHRALFRTAAAFVCLLTLTLGGTGPAVAQPAGDLYEQGVAARRSGDWAGAAALLGRLVAAEPDNADARLQLGFALLALGRLEEAQAAFSETLRLAPDYADARIGLARVAQRRGDREDALAALGPVDPANAEARELRQALERAPEGAGRVRLDVDLSVSDLESPRSDWREGAVRLRYEATDDLAIGGAVELSDRGTASDVYVEARLDARVAPGSAIYVALGGTPDADFRPEWQLSAGGSARVRGGSNPTALTLDGRLARYGSGAIQVLSPGIEQYLAGGRFWLTARWINIFDEDGEHRSGWLARGDLMASERLRLFAGLADAPDTSEGAVIDTFSIFAGLSWDVTVRNSLRLSIAHEDREIGSDRFQLSVGTGMRF